jgi:putative transposase
MRLVERRLIKRSHSASPKARSHPCFKEIDLMAFKSKNLFNSALYICRKLFFAKEPVPGFNRLYHQLKASEDYKALPSNELKQRSQKPC